MTNQTSLGWSRFFDPDTGIAHIIPQNDIKDHEFSRECWCHPEDDLLAHGEEWMHNSADDRESIETGKRKPS